MEPKEVEEQEAESERFWKTPNTLDAEGLRAASNEARPEDTESLSAAPSESEPPSTGTSASEPPSTGTS
jgi:hypothetical protein